MTGGGYKGQGERMPRALEGSPSLRLPSIGREEWAQKEAVQGKKLSGLSTQARKRNSKWFRAETLRGGTGQGRNDVEQRETDGFAEGTSEQISKDLIQRLTVTGDDQEIRTAKETGRPSQDARGEGSLRGEIC